MIKLPLNYSVFAVGKTQSAINLAEILNEIGDKKMAHDICSRVNTFKKRINTIKTSKFSI